MNKEQLWEVYCSKNPSFKDPDNKITMTARGLKKMFEQTWKTASINQKENDNFGEMFSDLFGRGKK